MPDNVRAQLGRAINLLEGTAAHLEAQSDPAIQERGKHLREAARALRKKWRNGGFFMWYRHEQPHPWVPRNPHEHDYAATLPNWVPSGWPQSGGGSVIFDPRNVDNGIGVERSDFNSGDGQYRPPPFDDPSVEVDQVVSDAILAEILAHELEHCRQNSKNADGTDKDEDQLDDEHVAIYNYQLRVRQDIRTFLESVELLSSVSQSQLDTFESVVTWHRDNL